MTVPHRPFTRALMASMVAAAAAACPPAAAMRIGVNIDASRTTAEISSQRAAIVRNRGLNAVRIGIPDSWGDTGPRRDQAARIVANGGYVTATIFPTFSWDTSCSRDLAGIESRAYGETVVAVNKMKDIVHDFELMNEVQNRADINREVPRDSAITSSAPYYGKPCVASLTAALKGMSRAVYDVKAQSGLPLRVIMSGVGRDFGYIDYLISQGLRFDVLGWHFYPYSSNESIVTDPWYGPGGAFRQLAKFGRPVHINEFNCGDIYRAEYENREGMQWTEECLRGFGKHMAAMLGQNIVNLEFIAIYMLDDNPALAGSEAKFGLMYDLGRPKVHMYLAQAFAGGPLTSAERYEITRRGLMTEQEIEARRAILR